MSDLIEIEVECSSCSGTGVYVGMGERDGASVMCYQCKGTGKTKIRYTEFTGRKKAENVKRVYLKNYGYCLAPKEIDFKNIGKVDMSKEGVSYEDFLKGETPTHMKQMGCPMTADQGMCHDIKGFSEWCNQHGSSIGSTITDCKNQCNKLECWHRLELLQKSTKC
jgi:hypothetical protein